MDTMFRECRLVVEPGDQPEHYRVTLFEGGPRQWTRTCEARPVLRQSTARHIERTRQQMLRLPAARDRDTLAKLLAERLLPPPARGLLLAYLDGPCERSASDVDLIALGKALADFLLHGAVGQRFSEIHDEAVAGRRMVRLRLDLRAEDLRDCPWEFLRWRSAGTGAGGAPAEFLATSPWVSIVRESNGPEPDARRLDGRATRVLVVWADPKGTGLLPAGGLEEVLAAAKALSQALSQDLELEFVGGGLGSRYGNKASRSTIRGALERERWDVVFFVCHGQETGILVDPDDGGDCETMGPEELAGLLGGAGVQVALFDVCLSSKVGLAVAQRVPIVVVNQFLLTLAAAATFWRGFFHAMSEPLPFDLCVGAGRMWIENVAWGLPDWGTPVLYRGARARPVPRTRAPAEDAAPGGQAPPERTDWLPKAARAFESVLPGRVLLDNLDATGEDAGRRTLEAILGLNGKEQWWDDPWRVWTLGEATPDGAGRWPQPIWWTALRHPPPFLVWPRRPEAVRYTVELDHAGADLPVELQTADNLLRLPPPLAALTEGQVRWNVAAVTGSGQHVPCTQGVFRLLTAPEATRLAQAEQQADAQRGGLLGSLALAEAWVDAELYDDAIRRLRLLAHRHGNGPEGFLVRRTLAAAFKAVFDKMNGLPYWPGPEVDLAAAENNRYVKLAYCAALRRLAVYRAGGCDSCNQCGLAAPDDVGDAPAP